VFPEHRESGDKRVKQQIMSCCVSPCFYLKLQYIQSRNHVIINHPKFLTWVLTNIKPKCRVKKPKMQCKIIYKKVSVFKSYQMNVLPQEKLH